MNVVVTGMGLVSALGTLETSWRRLLANESGIKFHQPFESLPPMPLGLIDAAPVDLVKLTQQVVTDALQNAALVPPLPNCGIVMGSSRGHQGKLEQYSIDWILGKSMTHCQLPHLLHHQLGVMVADQVGAKGPVLTPMAACATGIWSIFQGFELIQMGYCDQVIVGAVEGPSTPLTLAGFRQMGALATTGAYPFDRDREGFVLGEGAAVLVLESAASAKQRGAKIYGQVLGFGLTNDAYSANAPDPSSRSAMAAIQQCLNRSRTFPSEINYIHAHGTATQLNDQQEAHLIQRLFPQGVPVSSTKGATGHTLGASGMLGVIFSLMALQAQILPPCVGLNNPAFDLDFVRVPRSTPVERVLCFSFGFGGQNAVIILGKANIASLKEC